MSDVILVNMKDEAIGTMEKMKAHQEARLHRAFSVFLFNGDKILLQKRALNKYHCGGLWTNTCCSHPAPGESLEAAAARRLQEELGIENIDLKEMGSFVYRFPFPNGITEFEFDHVLIGKYNGPVKPDPSEVEAVRWEAISRILQECKDSATDFTPWFITAIGIALKEK